MWPWFSHFFENAFVSLVKRRIPIRMLRFCRSAYDVEMCSGSGSPHFTSPVACGESPRSVRSIAAAALIATQPGRRPEFAISANCF